MKKEKTFTVKIYLSGDISVIKQSCRAYCKEVGLCVTISPTLFIYTGGEEYGVEIGLLNYPRFPDTDEGIIKKATELARICRKDSFQDSYLIVTPETTIWNSIREQE